MRLFNDLRKNLNPQPLGLVAADFGFNTMGGGTPLSHLPKAPLYLAGALVLGLALLAMAPHHSTDEASLNQIEWQAKDGSADAQLLLAMAYRNGNYGLKADAGNAATWLSKAAQGGNAYAAGLLGDAYDQGTGVQPNHGQAVYWWQRAAQGGDRHAAAELGQDVTQTERLAQLWGMNNQSGEALKRRALDGDNVAQFQLAMRYRDGAWGVNADPRLALGWLEQAAKHGNPVAMKTLAEAYEKGDLGLTADATKAAQWLKRAELAGAARS